MKSVNVVMHVFPHQILNHGIDLFGIPENSLGKEFSNETEIKVNKTVGGYSILYDDYVFANIDNKSLVNSIINLFVKNLKSWHINFEVQYHVNVDKFITLTAKGQTFYFEQDYHTILALINKVLEFSNIISDILHDSDESIKSAFSYSISESLRSAAVTLSEELKKINSAKENNEKSSNKSNKSLEYYRNDDDEDDEDNKKVSRRKYDDEDGFDLFKDILTGNYTYTDDDDDEGEYEDDEDEDDYEDDPKPKKRRKKRRVSKPSYGESRVVKDAKNPKKSYNRHGVVVCSKDDIKKDEKILKEFLKDFIPGDANWKKDFRSDIVKRWIKMYAVTNKQLKQLEKQHRRARLAKRNKSSIDTDRALEFTRKLFNTPIDRWNDPSK